jgi:ubiquitin-conjugating enzyme (huntingtin interacting protein 2)
LCALLSAPEPDSPQEAVVAHQYKHDIKGFNAKVRDWVQEYALIKPEDHLKVEQLFEMGFDRAKCRLALEKCGGDLAAAVDYLFSM